MTERHLIAYAILLAFLVGGVLLWYFVRRGRRGAPHLRIDLLGKKGDEPPGTS
ncbi:MAG: hypothetical protein QOG72_3085 [Sphingomonadales bacterium]|jgi:hypothetical protein|nr:hypothetical protein [Sphingomonadales bacterium]